MISISKFPVNFILGRIVFQPNYLVQNLFNYKILGLFQNPQDEQNPKLSPDLRFYEDFEEENNGFRRCLKCNLPAPVLDIQCNMLHEVLKKLDIVTQWHL